MRRLCRTASPRPRHRRPPRGRAYDAFRPATPQTRSRPRTAILRLPPPSRTRTSAPPPGRLWPATWSGIFDTAYTRPGDYLAGPAGIFFIAAQQALLPALCVLTTRTIAVSRAAAPAPPGVNAYGGLHATTATPVLTAWPASILFAGAGSPGDLPGDASTPTWTVLLPNTPAPIAPADLITDDRGSPTSSAPPS